jgi:hypothetical protein
MTWFQYKIHRNYPLNSKNRAELLPNINILDAETMMEQNDFYLKVARKWKR